MTVTTESMVEVPAWTIEQGDVIFVPALDEYVPVVEVRHRDSTVAGWTVTLTLDTGIERDYFVVSAYCPIHKAA